MSRNELGHQQEQSRQGAQGRNRLGLAPAAPTRPGVRRAARRRLPRAAAVVARVAAGARRMVAAAVALPMPALAPVVAAELEQAAQLPRPRGCRKTGKTCCRAGSRRRTAYTRSCEKLPSSSYAAPTCTAKRREHTRFGAFADISAATKAADFGHWLHFAATPRPAWPGFHRDKAPNIRPKTQSTARERLRRDTRLA